MHVSVVDVRVVRMAVSQRRVGVLVNVGLGTIRPVGMFVAMMLVVVALYAWLTTRFSRYRPDAQLL